MEQPKIRNPHLQELHDMVVTLARDYDFCVGHFGSSQQEGFWRRSLVRTVCALVEGVTCLMLRHVLALKLSTNDTKDIALMSALTGQQAKVDEAGNVRPQPMFVPARDNVSFAFRVYADAFASKYRLQKNDTGWAALKEVFRIRDRITHPKVPSDLQVSEQEIATAKTAFAYFLGCLMYLYDDSLLLQYNKLKSEIANSGAG